mmetsp:Transcript_60190/g.123624  ORF Transcript_60190/g.123624 Transcript_60190/m.123624 type:complete len:269 (-) Transcript_60190:605-1411(-)
MLALLVLLFRVPSFRIVSNAATGFDRYEFTGHRVLEDSSWLLSGGGFLRSFFRGQVARRFKKTVVVGVCSKVRSSRYSWDLVPRRANVVLSKAAVLHSYTGGSVDPTLSSNSCSFRTWRNQHASVQSCQRPILVRLDALVVLALSDGFYQNHPSLPVHRNRWAVSARGRLIRVVSIQRLGFNNTLVVDYFLRNRPSGYSTVYIVCLVVVSNPSNGNLQTGKWPLSRNGSEIQSPNRNYSRIQACFLYWRREMYPGRPCFDGGTSTAHF